MIDKGPDRSYKHSHKKITKSFAKALDIKYRIGQNSQPRSLAASQPRSLAASQPHSFTAEALSCLNEIFTIKTNYSNHAQRQPVSKIPTFCLWAFFIYSDVEKPIKAFQLTPTSPNILFRKMGFLGAKPISRTFLFSGL